LTAIIPYLGEDIEHKSTIQMSEEIEDNSDVPERFVPGNFTRLSIQLVVPNAYLWDTRVKDTVSIKGFEVEAQDEDY